MDENTSPDGNVTVSTLSLVPSVLEAGSLLVCQAGNPRIQDSTLESAWKLEIHCKYFIRKIIIFHIKLFFLSIKYTIHSPIQEDFSSKKCSVDATYAKWKFGSNANVIPFFEIFWREKLKKINFKVFGLILREWRNKNQFQTSCFQRWRCSFVIKI